MKGDGMASMESQDRLLVTFHRSGGFTGEIDQLTIGEDGRATAQTKRGRETFEVDQATVGDLRQKLEDANLPEQPPPHDTHVRDGYSYSVEFGGSKAEFMDGGIPEEVKPALAALNSILRQHGGS